MAEVLLRREEEHGAFTALYRAAGLEIGDGWEEICHPVFSAAVRRGNELLGAVTVSRRFERLLLDYLAVVPAARGQGFGRMLTERCLRFAREAGERSLWLASREPGFFKAVGASETEDTAVLEDCLRCPEYRNCRPKELVFYL